MGHIIIIGGATASGKSALALALARTLSESGGAVILNGDSQQIYRELPIVTAQPSHEEMQEVPHRLYGHIGVRERYDVKQWLEEVSGEIKQVQAEGHTPIVVGGTGMYLSSLVEGVADVPDIPDEVRETMRELLETVGNLVFYQLLKKRDPQMAERLNANDSQRMLRAMEVVEHTGKSLADYQAGEPTRYVSREECICVKTTGDRAKLHDAIDARFVAMTKEGALEEVQALIDTGVPEDAPGMKALGVPELLAHLKGERSLEEATDKAQAASRQYAKRQLTWFRNQCADWAEATSADEIVTLMNT